MEAADAGLTEELWMICPQLLFMEPGVVQGAVI